MSSSPGIILIHPSSNYCQFIVATKKPLEINSVDATAIQKASKNEPETEVLYFWSTVKEKMVPGGILSTKQI